MSKSSFYIRMAWSNIRTNKQIYLPYLISSLVTVFMFYTMASLVPAIQTTTMYGGSSVQAVLEFGVVVLQIFSLIFLFYTNSFIIRRRKKEFGLYNILGMEKKHIAYVVVFETAMIALISCVLGTVLGIVFSKVMLMIFGRILSLSTAIKFSVPAAAILKTFGLFAVVFALTLAYNILQIILSNPIDLLHGGSKGEKEPKVKWIPALLGLICLGAGYYIAVSITNPLDALLYFFIAVVLVIFGTYFLFMAGMTALLKFLKNRKSYYYSKKHFITVSGMLYRMKQNAAGLSTICILSTCILVMVSTTFSMYISMDDILKTRFPHQFIVTNFNYNDESELQLRNLLDQSLKGYEITSITEDLSYPLTAIREGNSFTEANPDRMSNANLSLISLYSLDQFNQQFHTSYELSEGQLLYFKSGGPLSGDDIELMGLNYKAVYPDTLPENLNLDDVYDTGAMVFADQAAISHLFAHMEEQGNMVPVPFYTCGFDIDGDREMQLKLLPTLRENLSELDVFVESREGSSDDLIGTYGGLFFLGIFLGFIFIMALVLIIYYKQVSEGYEDRNRFVIMQQVGMSHGEVKKTIHSQVLMVFFIPLAMSLIHLAFAMPMLIKILAILNMVNLKIILLSTAIIVLFFIVIYVIVYLRTAKTYYNIVES